MHKSSNRFVFCWCHVNTIQEWTLTDSQLNLADETIRKQSNRGWHTSPPASKRAMPANARHQGRSHTIASHDSAIGCHTTPHPLRNPSTLGCYAILPPQYGPYTTSSTNQKYITHCYVVKWGPSHGHNWHVQKNFVKFGMWLLNYASGQTNMLITILRTAIGGGIMNYEQKEQ